MMKLRAAAVLVSVFCLLLSSGIAMAQGNESNIIPEKKDFQGQIKLVSVRSSRANNDNSRKLQGLVESLNKWTDVNARLDQSLQLDSPKLIGYPLLYIETGKTFEPLDSEKKMIADYLSSGGFLLIEFDLASYPGFKSVLPENARLDIIPSNHPIYNSYFKIDSSVWTGHVQKNLGNRSGDRIIGPYLMGIWMGNKLVGIYSDKDMGAAWLEYLNNGQEDSRVRVGVNIVVYLLSQKKI